MGQYVYGPVPSRRLGRSLGLDLVPYKTCTYDCIYCQLGKTPSRTVERKAWVPIDEVAEEAIQALDRNPDYITLSGSGEPTLCTGLDRLIGRIKEATSTPVAVITNGSLLWQKQVREELMDADLVVPSLDAGDETTFRHVNRPHGSLSFERMLEGLIALRREFTGEYWLEVFILGGITSSDAQIEKIARCVDRIQPGRIQLNTVTRPPAVGYARPASPQRMAELAMRFDPPAEVIADFAGESPDADVAATREEVLEMLRRRPCSVADVASGLGTHPNEIIKHLDQLGQEDLVVQSRSGDTLYYSARPRA